MKKLFAILLAVIIAALALMGCRVKGEVNNEPERLTYEELVSLQKVRLSEVDRPIFDDLAEAYAFFGECEANPTLALAEVLSVKYYYVWNKERGRSEGHTVTELRVTETMDGYNPVGVKTGDVKYVYQYSCIRFKNNEDKYAFYSDKYGKPIENIDALKEMDGGIFELIPIKGVQYDNLLFDNEYPMKAGESYTLLLNEMKRTQDGNALYYAHYVRPVKSETSLADFAKEHGFIYDEDCIAVAEEIAAMFK